MLREYFIWPYIPSSFLQIIQYSTRIAKIHKFLLSISVYMSLPLLNHSMLSKHIKKIHIRMDMRDPESRRWSVNLNFWIFFQIKMLLTMAADYNSEKDIKDNYLFFRFASWALVVDPWIYVLLRREIIMNVCIFFQRQQRPLLTSSGDAVERKTNDESKSLANDEKRASYGTI